MLRDCLMASDTLRWCGADAGQTARNDLAALGHEALQQPHIAVADGVDLLGAELADLLAPEELPSAGAAGAAAGRRGPPGPPAGPRWARAAGPRVGGARSKGSCF